MVMRSQESRRREEDGRPQSEAARPDPGRHILLQKEGISVVVSMLVGIVGEDNNNHAWVGV